jgi:hypothetical protein
MIILGKEVFYHLNHPITWVRLTGVIVGIDEWPERRIVTLDDSSGICIDCMCAVPAWMRAEEAKQKAMLIEAQLSNLPANKAAGAPNQAPRPPSASVGSRKIAPEQKGNVKGAGNEQEKSNMKAEDNMKRKGKGNGSVETTPSPLNPQIPWPCLDTGIVVKVKGQIIEYRGVKQVNVIKMDILKSTEQEVKCWNEVGRFQRDILAKPWFVSSEDEERCRREKEKGGRSRRDKLGKDGDRRKREERQKEKRRSGEERSSKRKGSEIHGRDAEKTHRKESKTREGLDPVNKMNYPSRAVRRKIVEKPNALSI